MAVTRINNNQISDASAGNVYVGVNAAAKLQAYSITSTKLANNLTYGSDLVITGNLTIQGNTTTVDTTYTTIQDPVILLASHQTGAPAVDIGFIGQRGTSNNVAWVWQESSKSFIAAYTSTADTLTTITVSSFADIKSGNANVGSNLVVNGTTSLVGNLVGAVNATANITGGNLLTPGIVSAASYIGSVVSVSGNITSAANISGGNVLATTTVSAVSLLGSVVSVSANVTGGNLITGGAISATGNISTAGNITANYYFGNGSQLTGVTASTSGFPVTAGTSNIAAATNGNIGITVAGTSNVVTIASTGLYTSIVSASGNITSAANISGGNVLATTLVSGASHIGSVVSVTANVTGGNILTGGQVSAAANVTGGNLLTGGLISATATITGGNLATAGTASATGNITGGNVLTGGLISATGNITSAANVQGANIIATTAVVTPSISGSTVTISATGGAITLSPSSNVSVSSKYINNLADPVQNQDAATKAYVDNVATTGITIHQAVYAATNVTLESATGGTITYAQPNGAGNGVGATLTVSGGTFNLIDTANIQTANTRVLVKNQANGVQNGVYYWSNATVLIRTTDTDEYGADSANAFSVNDYFFTTNGNVNAGAAFVVSAPTGTITFGTSNIQFSTFSTSQTYTANTSAGLSLVGTVFNAKVDNNTTAFDGGGNIIVKASANLTTPNIGAATGTSLSVTGNLTGAGANISGNVSGGNILTGGLVSATGNITSAANISGGNVLATTTVSAASLLGSVVSASANITGGNLLTGGLISATSTITSAANITGGNILTGGLISATSTITSAANVIGGNLTTGGQVSSTGNITSAANISGGNVLATTTVSAASHIGSIVSVTANVTGGNLLTGGLISATSTITSAANVIGGNLTTGGQVSSTGNITSAANISGGNVLATTTVSAVSLLGTTTSMSGNVIGANVNTASMTLNGSNINSNTSSIIVNSNSGSVNFAVNGTAANVFYINATTNTASFGNSTQTTNALVAFNSTNSILFPVGNTAQRPGTGVTGMIRFNTTTNAVEVYDNSTWTQVGTPSFTVISDQQFNGNGVQTAFTLSQSTTSAATIVSINGVVQIPTLAYSVSGTTLTFTEAPLTGDVIDVRILVTTTSVTSISNTPGNAVIAVNPTVNEISITGNVIPVSNVTQSLGSASQQWKSLYVAGNTIYLGGLQLTASGSTFTVYQSDGTTPAAANTTINTTNNITVGGILNAGANGAGNIGNSTTYFNTVFAKATSAQYADLAEMYAADATYPPGTVLSFGGEKEVTLTTFASDTRVAGVVSTNPSYIMNSTLESEHTATVALTGRVPTMVSGPVTKGDMMVSAGNGRAMACATPAIGTVIGKALENHNDSDGIIEVVVGRL